MLQYLLHFIYLFIVKQIKHVSGPCQISFSLWRSFNDYTPYQKLCAIVLHNGDLNDFFF